MTSIPAGELDRRVTLMNAATGQDPTTGDAATPTPFGSMWAGIKPMSGSERYAAGQFVDKANTVISIRYQADLCH